MPTAKGRIMIKGTDGVLAVASDINDKAFTINPPPAVCGNAKIEGVETCDDGNVVSGDGCSSVCKIEPIVCGNAKIETGETCDDANTVAGDGCSATCQTETVTTPAEPTDEPVTDPNQSEEPATEETPTETPVEDTPTDTPGQSPVLGPYWQPVLGNYVRSEFSTTVYYLDTDPTTGVTVRRPFLDSQTYFTYESNFDAVHLVKEADLNAIPLDGVMLPKPGVVLIKLLSNHDVHTLEIVDGVPTLHWIVTEELAQNIFGPDWADYVMDSDPALWDRFVQGTPITTPITVDMSIMKKRFDLHP
jgi:cysteine-rich repeat protein